MNRVVGTRVGSVCCPGEEIFPVSSVVPPPDLDVAGLAARVAQLAGGRGSRAGKLEAGRLVFEACYRGDEARFAARGRGSVTLRALAAAAGDGLSATTLWRLARAHVAASSLPAALAEGLSLAQLTKLGAVAPGATRGHMDRPSF